MFHVKHGRLGRKQFRVRLEAGRYDLTTEARYAPHKPAERIGVKLGRRVIQQQKQSLLQRRLCCFGRSEHHRTGKQFLLPAGNEFARLVLIVNEFEIGPVRSGLGAALLNISVKAGFENLKQGPVFTPARAILKARLASEEIKARLFQAVVRNLERHPSPGVELSRQLNKLAVPAPDCRYTSAGLQRCISLLQRPPKPPPDVQVTMFHVKRDPVEISTALFRRPGHQAMNVWIDNLQRQGCRQRRRAAVILAVYPNLEAHRTVAHTDATLALAGLNPPEQYELSFAVPDQALRRRAAKRFTPTQVRQCLQQACFAGRVRTIDQIAVWVSLQLYADQAAKIARRELLDWHLVLARLLLQAHRHNNKLAVILAGLPYQAARVPIQY